MRLTVRLSPEARLMFRTVAAGRDLSMSAAIVRLIDMANADPTVLDAEQPPA